MDDGIKNSTIVSNSNDVDIEECSWTDDINNPLNWPMKAKIYHSLFPGLVALVS
jgi:hypothetical protein